VAVNVRDGREGDVSATRVEREPVEPAARSAVKDSDGSISTADEVGALICQDGVRKPVLVQVAGHHTTVVVQPGDREWGRDVEQRRDDSVFKWFTAKVDGFGGPAMARGADGDRARRLWGHNCCLPDK